MSLLPSATISISAALVFQIWPLANGRRLLAFISTGGLDGGKPDSVQSGIRSFDNGSQAALSRTRMATFRASPRGPGTWGRTKTYQILLGNCEELLSDFIETLFQEVCQGKAAVQCTRTSRVGDFVRAGCEREFDLIIQIPHYLNPESTAQTPMGYLGEGLRAIRTIKTKRLAPIIAIVAFEERARYEPLLLEAGADCVLELPFAGEQLTTAVGRQLQMPDRLERFKSKPWFFAGILMRGLQLLRQAEVHESALLARDPP
jgi:CheY-like chemotaxis protein